MATRAAGRGGELLLKSVLATRKQLCVGTLWLISRSQETREMDSIIHDCVYRAFQVSLAMIHKVSLETISFMIPEIFDRNG